MRRIAYQLMWLACFLLLKNGYYLYKVGNGLSPYADDYSESNTIRAGEDFADNGFFSHYGFPNYHYGDRFIGEGFKQHAEQTQEIYTGYPPGADWLAGIYTRVFGKGNYRYYRIIPVCFSLAASLFLFACVFHIHGTAKSAVICWPLCLMPMFANCSHGLYCWGYSFDLFLLQLGVVILWGRVNSERRSGFLVLLGLLTFLQGWLSYDYFFLSTFAPVPLILLQSKELNADGWRKIFLAVCVSGLAFAAAHAIRFGLLVQLEGGLTEAISEVISKSKKRYAEQLEPGFSTGRLMYAGDALWTHLKSQFTFTSLCLPWSWFIPVLAILVGICRNGTMEFHFCNKRKFTAASYPTDLVAVLLAFLIATSWILAMPYHSKPHISWIGRHFFLLYFVSILMVVSRTSLLRRTARAV